MLTAAEVPVALLEYPDAVHRWARSALPTEV
jgi:hypothetical protein